MPPSSLASTDCRLWTQSRGTGLRTYGYCAEYWYGVRAKVKSLFPHLPRQSIPARTGMLVCLEIQFHCLKVEMKNCVRSGENKESTGNPTSCVPVRTQHQLPSWFWLPGPSQVPLPWLLVLTALPPLPL